MNIQHIGKLQLRAGREKKKKEKKKRHGPKVWL